MTDLIYDYITTGIDLMLIGGILSAFIIMLKGSSQLSQVISNQQATAQEYDYYLRYHSYDDTKGLSSSDALSAMIGFRYDLYVVIGIDGEYIYNDPRTGYFYKTTIAPEGYPTGDMVSNIFIDSNKITYQELSDALSPIYIYKSKVASISTGYFKTEMFNRNTVVTGIFMEKTGTV